MTKRFAIDVYMCEASKLTPYVMSTSIKAVNDLVFFWIFHFIEQNFLISLFISFANVELANSESSTENGSLINTILASICGALCSDTPLAQAFGKQNYFFLKKKVLQLYWRTSSF